MGVVSSGSYPSFLGRHKPTRNTPLRVKNLKTVKNLYVETVTYKPVNFDFSKGYAEQWDIALELTDEEQENEEFFPMMNYMYPLPDGEDFERDMEKQFGPNWRKKAKKVLDNTTIVYFEESGEYFLALTGGGMDFRWEICASYIGLGYLPPLHFCDLPRMADKDMTSKRTRRIANACLRSTRLAQAWAKSTEKELRLILKEKHL